MDARIVGFGRQRLFEVLDRPAAAVAGALADFVQSQEVLVVALEIDRPLRQRPPCRQQLDRERTRQMVGDFSLDVQDVGDGPLVCVRPQLRLFRGPHQLRRDPDSLPGPPHASLEQVVHAEVLADLGGRVLPMFVSDGRPPGDHAEPGRMHLTELRDQFLGEPVGEIFLALVLAQVLEGKHGQHRPRRARWRLPTRAATATCISRPGRERHTTAAMAASARPADLFARRLGPSRPA